MKLEAKSPFILFYMIKDAPFTCTGHFAGRSNLVGRAYPPSPEKTPPCSTGRGASRGSVKLC